MAVMTRIVRQICSRLTLGLFVATACILLSCSSENTPETIAGAFVNACEKAFEQRKAGKLRSLISPRYLDQQGRNSQDTVGIASMYILQNQSIHVLARLTAAFEQDDGTIRASVLTALAGSPIKDESSLPAMNADMYWFDIVLTEEDGTWLLTSAAWRQAMLDDFL